MGHIELLRRNAGFRLLFLATLGSLLGTWLATIALQVDVWDRTHSGSWVSALLIAFFLPTVLVGVAVGPLLDRLSRRGLMIAADLLRAGVFVALPFVDRPAWIVALAGISGLGNAVYRPAVNAGMPNLLQENELEKGNALFQTVENMAWAAGPLIGGTIVATAGSQAAYWVNAASFVFSALLLRLIAAPRLQSEVSLSRGHWRDLAEGLALARRSPAVHMVLTVWSITMLSVACINVGEVVIAKSSFNAGSFGFGLLAGSSGVGLAIGSFIGGMLAERRGIGRLYGPAIVLAGVGYGLAAFAPNVWVALPFVLVAGMGNGAAALYNVLLIQRGVPDTHRGRAFTIAMSVTYAILGPAMAAAGPVTSALGGRWIWAIGASFSVLSGIVAIAMAPRLRAATPTEAEVVEPPLDREVDAAEGEETDLERRRQEVHSLVEKGIELDDLSRSAEALHVYDEAVERFAADTDLEILEHVTLALGNKALVLRKLGRRGDEIAAHDELLARFGDAAVPELREPVALALNEKGLALVELNRHEEALAAFAEVESRFGADDAARSRVSVARALFNKGTTLGELGRLEEAIAAYDEVLRRVGDDPSFRLRLRVAETLAFKGFALSRLERGDEAVAAYAELVERFGYDHEQALRRQVALALLNTGRTLNALGRSEEALDVYDDLRMRCADATEPELQTFVARALVGKGWTLGRLERHGAAIDAYEDAIVHFEDSIDPVLREQVARALVGKAVTLAALNRRDEAIVVYRAVVARFGAAREPEVRERVARALRNLGATLGRLGRKGEAIAVYDELLERFSGDESRAIGEDVAHARQTRESLLSGL